MHRKLDKNLKNESSVDLMKYLQEKQRRTRRMSRAVMSGGTPMGSQYSVNLIAAGGRAVVANQAAYNYKRRLSLSLPERPKIGRNRSYSDFTGVSIDPKIFNSIKNADIANHSPGRRKKKYRKARSLNQSPEMSPLINQNFIGARTPWKPSSPTGRIFEVIHEHEVQGNEKRNQGTSKNPAAVDASMKRRLRLKKARTVSEEDSKSDSLSIQKQISDPLSGGREKTPAKVKFEITSEIAPKSRNRKHMQAKSASLDHIHTSVEFSEENLPNSGQDSCSSFESVCFNLGSSPVESDSDVFLTSQSKSDSSNIARSPEKSNNVKLQHFSTRTVSNAENIDLSVPEQMEHTGRKVSYVKAMSDTQSEDNAVSVELKDFKKGGNKSSRKHESL